MRWGIGLRVAAATALVGAAIASGGAAQADAPPSLPALHQAGRWFVEPDGRVVTMHGFNESSKATPTMFPGDLTDDFAWMQANGFDTLRLVVFEASLEPSPGSYDETYISTIRGAIRQAAADGIRVFVDLHQDQYGPAFGYDGFPAWATDDDGLSHSPDLGFPGDQFGLPAMLRAYDHLWANDPGSGDPVGQAEGIGIQDRTAASMGHLAGELKDEPGLLGYDYLNEPWPGSPYAQCLAPTGCPVFDQTLTAFNRRIAAAIHAADPGHIAFGEPVSTFNDGVPTSIGDQGVTNEGFAFHVYCLAAPTDTTSTTDSPQGSTVCPQLEQKTFANAMSHVATSGEVPFLTEFGAVHVPSEIRRLAVDADGDMLSWAYWKLDEGPIFDITKPPTGANLDAPVVAELVRPYPKEVAGTPTGWSFDPDTSAFDLDYTTTAVDTPLATDVTHVFVPTVHYSDGYQVTVTGGHVISPPGVQDLLIETDPGASAVHAEVTPPDGPTASVPESPAVVLLALTAAATVAVAVRRRRRA